MFHLFSFLFFRLQFLKIYEIYLQFFCRHIYFIYFIIFFDVVYKLS